MATRAAAPTSRFDLVSIKNLLTKTFTNWSTDNVPRLAAAFSFYAVLSLAPVLVLAVVAAGYIYGEGTARQELLTQARAAVGPQGASLVSELLDNANKPGASAIATVLSLLVTFFSASNLFIALQETVNVIWGVQQKGPLLKGLILTRVTAFLSVTVFGLIVLGWLTLDSWLGWLERHTQGFQGWQVVSLAASLLFLTGVFGVALKQLPPNRLQWRDVWPGAFVTALGFGISKLLLALYFSYANVSAAYGSAGALVVILLWIYYSSQIFFFGVELTYTYAHTRGSLVGEERRDLQYS
jgi:membrane protein